MYSDMYDLSSVLVHFIFAQDFNVGQSAWHGLAVPILTIVIVTSVLFWYLVWISIVNGGDV